MTDRLDALLDEMKRHQFEAVVVATVPPSAGMPKGPTLALLVHRKGTPSRYFPLMLDTDNRWVPYNGPFLGWLKAVSSKEGEDLGERADLVRAIDNLSEIATRIETLRRSLDLAAVPEHLPSTPLAQQIQIVLVDVQIALDKIAEEYIAEEHRAHPQLVTVDAESPLLTARAFLLRADSTLRRLSVALHDLERQSVGEGVCGSPYPWAGDAGVSCVLVAGHAGDHLIPPEAPAEHTAAPWSHNEELVRAVKALQKISTHVNALRSSVDLDTGAEQLGDEGLAVVRSFLDDVGDLADTGARPMGADEP